MAVQTRAISLTEKIQINDGSHILYFYDSKEQYVENLLSFIFSAKMMNQHAIIIESLEVYEMLLEKLGDTYENEGISEILHYKNNIDFYQTYGDFKFERALESFKETVQPFVDKELSVRVWGKVAWNDLLYDKEDMHRYECECDLTVSEIGYMTVCVYDGNEVPASIQTEMMRSHPYLMTDKDLVKSSLYNHKDHTVFPSLATQKKIETELDFYRQKLDFIHVIAHEVRNPLTVIKSFASILKSELPDRDIQAKLSLIEDYSVAIDHEIHHIIQTEQMLTVDTFWKTKLIKALPAIQEVVEVMSVKARTQNIILHSNLEIPSNTIMNGNLMGIKLIISNLLSNAIKYSHEGGAVTIDSYIKDQRIHIHIVDHGVGMTPENLERLYQKYQKINQEIAGQGIGLFMVYQIVKHFKGDIDISSEQGKGTEVKLSFPA
ncbi:two-component sensor histidine kinase [Halalkalibacter wakoensis JCM 9140]|uniref:histidine kinase n=1 Tax=Halalkalibacter wakoensis JCM 9140 TaxID=1236970 RepID=W4Q101_9BACI|nr:ATP-binding protein [Halalkalibacter wakoensis]GAE25620.1 two-component sensor histidine kinase [Halalkalibacter wakoensis JCM 9140]